MSTARLLIAIVFVALNSQCPIAVADVTVQFYLLQQHQWDSSGMAVKFKSALASGLTTYCASSLSACGLNATTDYNFTASDVYFSPGYPKNLDARYMKLTLFITYTLRTGKTVNLTASDLTAIVEMQRTEVYNRIGYYIVYIDDEFYSIPPPSTVNWVVVPVSCVATAMLALVAVLLGHRHRGLLTASNKDSIKPMTHVTTAAREDKPLNAVSLNTLQPTSRQATEEPKQRQQQQMSQRNCDTASPGSSDAILPGAVNEGFNQSGSDSDMRQRRTQTAASTRTVSGPTTSEELALTDVAEFMSAAETGVAGEN